MNRDFAGMAQDMKADRANFFAGLFRDFFGVGAMSHPTSQEMIDASSRAAAIGIANSQLIEYENAPHGLFATHKQKFAKDLLKFLLRDAHRAPRQQPVGIVPPADTATTASHAARTALR